MNSSIRLRAAVVAVFLLLPGLAAAESMQVTATFADGKGTQTAPVTDVVDAFPGMRGEGWAAGWTRLVGGSSTLSHAVVGPGDSSHIALVDANYLQYRFSTTGTSTRHSCIYRDYAPELYPDADHSIEFTVRIMEDLDCPMATGGTDTDGRFRYSNDRYEIHDRRDYDSGSYTYTGGQSTWGISVTGDNKYWQVKSFTYDELGNGTATSTSTGIMISELTPLTFKLDFDMSAGHNGEFDVTVTNAATDEQLYSGAGFGLGKALTDDTRPEHYSRQTTGRLIFDGFGNCDYKNGISGARESANYRNWDIDAIKVVGIPEPTTLVSGLGILLALAALRRRG